MTPTPAGAGPVAARTAAERASSFDTERNDANVPGKAGSEATAATTRHGETEPAADDDSAVYSAADEHIHPPELVTRGFLAPLLDGVDVRRTAIELVISKSGAVQHARVVTPSQSMKDAILLSRAKHFEFRPASKPNGTQVSYRLVIVVEEANP